MAKTSGSMNWTRTPPPPGNPGLERVPRRFINSPLNTAISRLAANTIAIFNGTAPGQEQFNKHRLRWTQAGYGVGAGVEELQPPMFGRTNPGGAGRRLQEEKQPLGNKEGLPQLEAWLNISPANAAFYRSLQPDEQATIRNMLGMYGSQLSPSYLTGVLMKNRRIKANEQSAMARYNPNAITGPTKKEPWGTDDKKWNPNYGSGYAYPMSYYGGGGGYDNSPYQNWITNLTNWNIK